MPKDTVVPFDTLMRACKEFAEKIVCAGQFEPDEKTIENRRKVAIDVLAKRAFEHMVRDGNLQVVVLSEDYREEIALRNLFEEPWPDLENYDDGGGNSLGITCDANYLESFKLWQESSPIDFVSGQITSAKSTEILSELPGDTRTQNLLREHSGCKLKFRKVEAPSEKSVRKAVLSQSSWAAPRLTQDAFKRPNRKLNKAQEREAFLKLIETLPEGQNAHVHWRKKTVVETDLMEIVRRTFDEVISASTARRILNEHSFSENYWK